MKKKETSDKSLLCVAGIFVCLAIIIMPPLFRKLMPKQETTVVTNDYVQLNCHTPENDEIIVVNYKGKDYGIGQLKYTYVKPNEGETKEYKAKILKTDMERSYNLDTTENAEHRTVTYVLSPIQDSQTNTLDSNDLLLLSIELKQAPENQKNYYEKLGFSCSVTDL